MLFRVGDFTAMIAVVLYAVAPAIRYTAHGLMAVPAQHVEAGIACGCTSRQLLWRVRLPLALPTIMLGINQTIMLALSMVVIASMIGAGGLGNTVLTGIQRLDVGLGFEGGLAVVVLAIILDRLTQSLSRPAALQLPRMLPSRAASTARLERVETETAGTGTDFVRAGT